jgi:hypothetical protein
MGFVMGQRKKRSEPSDWLLQNTAVVPLPGKGKGQREVS